MPAENKSKPSSPLVNQEKVLLLQKFYPKFPLEDMRRCADDYIEAMFEHMYGLEIDMEDFAESYPEFAQAIEDIAQEAGVSSKYRLVDSMVKDFYGFVHSLYTKEQDSDRGEKWSPPTANNKDEASALKSPSKPII